MGPNAIVYYYDRIRINSVIPIDDLKEILPYKNLQKNCNSHSAVIRKPSFLAQKHGYKSTIEAFQANDNFREILKGCDIGDHGIARIEIAKDYGFKTYKDLLNFQKYFIKNTIKLYSRDSACFIYIEA